MKRRAGILGAVLVLAHVPDLVRYGSKPWRERAGFDMGSHALRTYAQALDYPPNQVFIGARSPEDLWRCPRPWWGATLGGQRSGSFGEILPQREFYELLDEADQFDVVHLDGTPAQDVNGALPLFDGAETIGAVVSAHPDDENLQAHVLLENLSCKASGTHAVRTLLRVTQTDPESIEYALGCGEEAVGDRYQRGGGALAKAIAEAAGLTRASGCDIKAFCAAPVHALAIAGALVEARTYERVVVVAGGSLAKLGMKFQGAVKQGIPILEDVLAGMAVLVGEASDSGPVLRLDAVGRHKVRSGASQQDLLQDIVCAPLEYLGKRIVDIDRYATELHNPEITEPAGGGNVPERNYRMLAALAVLRGEIDRGEIASFERAHGLPGFAPTQGHIASAVPWLPHALARMKAGQMHTTMLLAKGSLFLGRMTRMWDGASVVLEA